MKSPFTVADGLFEETVRIRRRLHQYPELSGQEQQTLAFIRTQLDTLSIPYAEYKNGGICAIIGKGDRAVGVRGDVDALPVQEETNLPYASVHKGVMHACGHDIHTALLLSLARAFKAEEDTLPCMVKLFFQPAEETVGGAKVMVDSGCMESPKVEKVLALHVDPALPVGHAAYLPGKMNAAVIELDITVKGKACHGAHPEMGVDAIVAAAHMICALQSIPSRFTAPTTPVVLSIGTIHGGNGRNIIAGEVKLQGTVRVLDMETARQVKELIRRTAVASAAAFGAEAEVTLTDDYPALINHQALTLALAAHARELLGTDHVTLLDTPSMGADDFAYFTNAAPGCYFNLGVAGQQGCASLHSPHFAPDEGCIRTGLALLYQHLWACMEGKV